MSDLRNKIIRLAHKNPELRKDLLPLLTKKSGLKGTLGGAMQNWYASLASYLVKVEDLPIRDKRVTDSYLAFKLHTQRIENSEPLLREQKIWIFHDRVKIKITVNEKENTIGGRGVVGFRDIAEYIDKNIY